MTRWALSFLPEAADDLGSLDASVRIRVLKAIEKVLTDPLPQFEGGLGKPLGKKRTYDLSGLLKIKLKADGIRVVYKLVRENDEMRIVIVGVRSDEEVYREASRRREKHGL